MKRPATMRCSAPPARHARVPFGVEVALGYLAAKEAEWTAVRTVLSGRMAGVPAEALRERLREQYV